MEEAREVRTTCPYCGVGCGVLAKIAADGTTSVRGDPGHPANFGKLCSKGTALGETLGPEGRLLEPEIGGRQAGWDEALDLVAEKFSRAIAKHGPDSVAFYVSGQLLTEDYYVANKLMNSRLCMASSVAGHRRAFGEDIVPGVYEDFECADLIVLTGSNTAWCHPVLYRRMLAARGERGTKIVVIDPRRTATADACDLHLALDPGTDVLLFNGLLAHLVQSGKIDSDFIRDHTSGFDATAALACADAPSIARVAKGCGLAAADVQAFYDLFAETDRTLTAYSQGVNQSAHGTDKVNAIINCHLATGRIGRPGTGPFSVTGQPNAMGGREVGGLANQLAAHMDFADEATIDRVSRFWKAADIARRGGLKAVDMFQAVADGRIKALWVMGTNPAVSMPDASRVRAALAKCDFVVVSDVTRTDTTRYADVLLPAAAWSEKDGTVTNSERRISRQRPFLPAPGEARADWRIVCDVAARMGFGDAFAYQAPAEIFREHAALSA
ncbi:MAG: nitrate reductase, partial [Mesorhizobium sp.]